MKFRQVAPISLHRPELLNPLNLEPEKPLVWADYRLFYFWQLHLKLESGFQALPPLSQANDQRGQFGTSRQCRQGGTQATCGDSDHQKLGICDSAVEIGIEAQRVGQRTGGQVWGVDAMRAHGVEVGCVAPPQGDVMMRRPTGGQGGAPGACTQY